jgi:glycosyltransferase involved in cell wall biosynthesis
MGKLIQQQAVPLISVVMPVYNSAPFLAEAIESILSQTLRDFELLIVYDNSNDSSLEIIRNYQQVDNRIKIIYGINNGLIGALNQGMEAAQGKFVARMDSDDISLPLRFEKQVQLMESVGGDICGCHFLIINDIGKLVDAKLVPLCPSSFSIFLGYGVPFAHGSVMLRNSFVKKHYLRYGGVRFAEDYELWIKLFEKNAIFVNVNEFLFQYRTTHTSLSKRLAKKIAIDVKYLQKSYVLHNKVTYLSSVSDLMCRYKFLSEEERTYLLLGSYRASVNLKNLIFIKVARHSNPKILIIFILRFLRGI